MSRNRMKDSQSMHWMGVVKWVLIAGLVSGLGLSYMLCKNQNLRLAEETRALEKQLDTIERRNKVLAGDLEGMKSRRLLEKRLKDMKSPLVAWGDPRAVWERRDVSTRAVIARVGTLPSQTPNFEPPVANNSTPASSASAER
jgi:hypothetical protein